MNVHISRWSTLIVILGSIVMAGCGSKPADGRPTLVPVSGIVLFNNEPSANARVVFSPVAHQYAAAGLTDGNGRFQLQTFDTKDGAVPGAYKIVVSKFEVIDHPDGSFEENFFLPQRYRDPETSGLTTLVPDSGTDEIKVELVN